jgi:hypothetical protein
MFTGNDDRDLLVARPTQQFALEFGKFLELAYQVNTEIWDEEEHNSSYGSRILEAGSRWELRPMPETLKRNHGLSLGSLVKNILPGKGTKSDLKEGLPSTGANWIRTGNISAFQDSRLEGLVLANPGDVVTPSIGLLSQARVAKESMSVANGHYLLVLNADVDAEAVVNFLNSRIANQMRKHAVQSAIIPRISTSDLLKFSYVEAANYSASLRILMERVVTR